MPAICTCCPLTLKVSVDNTSLTGPDTMAEPADAGAGCGWSGACAGTGEGERGGGLWTGGTGAATGGVWEPGDSRDCGTAGAAFVPAGSAEPACSGAFAWGDWGAGAVAAGAGLG